MVLLYKDPNTPLFYERMLAGAISGMVSTCIIYPLDLAKIRLTLTHRKTYTGLNHVLAKTLIDEGVRGL